VLQIQAWTRKNAAKIVRFPPLGEECGDTDEQKGACRFKEALMSGATFASLTLRFGYPYVYIHDSTCHHVVLFTFARMFNKIDDVKLLRSYPIRRRYRRVPRKICQICMRQTAL
jgi:hypothetical protein